MIHSANFRFYAQLNDFLPPDKRHLSFCYVFPANPSIKDAIEAMGVPHPEVELLIVNGCSVDFNYLLNDQDNVAVYPVFSGINIARESLVKPPQLTEFKFILDVHLGRLAKYMRILGLDVLYENNYLDETIIELALSDKRIILTRDKGLLKNKKVIYGYWLRTTQSKDQLTQVISRYNLLTNIAPFKRCLVCNGGLVVINKSAIVAELPVNTNRYFQEFFRCNLCGKIYWQGSHYKNMLNWLATLK